MLSRALLFVSLLAALAAGSTPVGDHVAFMQRAGPSVEVSITPSGLSGQGIDLQRHGTLLQGTLFNEELQVRADASRVEGFLGGREVSVALSRDGEGLVASGSWAGMPLAVWFSDHAVRGYVGSCAYELARTGENYEGSSSCTGAPAPTLLHVPELLRQQPAGEQLVTLAIMLGSNVGAYEVTGPVVPPR